MKPFCEVITSSVLPAVRSIMARELLTTYKMTQQEAADILGITQAAVSQYSRQSRGSKVKMLESQKGLMKMID
ncbi:MAG: transcriptional regulator, partial [Candidatus Aenigmarchaeota archaeon]|nr:transcriptional regulator [Candidatus Aenigmarchaeota archaeon]